ncbi:MAG: hypothetical protein AB7P33_12815 [Dehalococcoidia bacterium]
MLLFKASLAAGIIVAVLLGVSGLVDVVNAFVLGSVAAGVSYLAGSMIKPGSNSSIMGGPSQGNADD